MLTRGRTTDPVEKTNPSRRFSMRGCLFAYYHDFHFDHILWDHSMRGASRKILPLDNATADRSRSRETVGWIHRYFSAAIFAQFACLIDVVLICAHQRRLVSR